MTNSPQGPEYDKMVDLALGILMDYEIYDFPLDLEALSKKLNINLRKYSKLDNIEYNKLFQVAPLGITFMRKYSDNHLEYDLWYNDIDSSEERNRFTIAHEIGHIVKEDLGKTITENDEILCDYFAKCLLAPQCLILHNFEFRKNTILTKYKVSRPVAENWSQAIENRITTFGINCLTNTEKNYINQIKKYYNHQPASN